MANKIADDLGFVPGFAVLKALLLDFESSLTGKSPEIWPLMCFETGQLP
jgi:hypothetical protein